MTKRTDTDRLNWLESNNKSLIRTHCSTLRVMQGEELPEETIYTGWAVTRLGIWNDKNAKGAETAREAIDKAMDE